MNKKKKVKNLCCMFIYEVLNMYIFEEIIFDEELIIYMLRKY